MHRTTQVPWKRMLVLGSALFAPVLAGGCGDESALAPPSAPLEEAGARLPVINDLGDIDPEDFVESIDNPFFPYIPGSRWVYRAETDEGTEIIEDDVTHDTKTILGVVTTVHHNRVTLDGTVIEDTFDWYAQDEAGNVWYFGEDTRSFDGDQVSTAGSWEAGVDGALPGIIMPARPRVGLEYAQEYYPGVAEDRARVQSLSARVTVPFGRFRKCLETLDWNPLEEGSEELKFYARGVGMVLEVKENGEGPRVELISFEPPEDEDSEDDNSEGAGTDTRGKNP